MSFLRLIWEILPNRVKELKTELFKTAISKRGSGKILMIYSDTVKIIN